MSYHRGLSESVSLSISTTSMTKLYTSVKAPTPFVSQSSTVPTSVNKSELLDLDTTDVCKPSASQPTRRSNKCSCTCVNVTYVNRVEFDNRNKVIKQLKLNGTKLSSYLRRKTSAMNTKTEVVHLGFIVCLTLCLPVSLFLLGADTCRVLKWIQQLRCRSK